MDYYRNRMTAECTPCKNNLRTVQHTYPSCSCSREKIEKTIPLAMAFVKWQEWGNIYCEDKALSRGTLFADLDLPFEGRRLCR